MVECGKGYQRPLHNSWGLCTEKVRQSVSYFYIDESRQKRTYIQLMVGIPDSVHRKGESKRGGERICVSSRPNVIEGTGRQTTGSGCVILRPEVLRLYSSISRNCGCTRRDGKSKGTTCIRAKRNVENCLLNGHSITKKKECQSDNYASERIAPKHRGWGTPEATV